MSIIQGTTTQRARLAAFRRFVIERERIRLRKDAGAERPWTKDPILQAGHFCNVRRRDDYVTKWIGDWIIGSSNHWFSCAVARWINQPETLTRLSPFVLNGWDPKGALKTLRAMHKNGDRIFNGAYIINGYKGMPKYESVIKMVLTPLAKKPPTIDQSSIENSWLALRAYHGMGSFMAGQIVADWQTFGIIDGEDVLTWAPLGPGSSRGLRWIYSLDRKPSQKEAVELMLPLHDEIASLSLFQDETLTLHDLQNCLCEFSKYVKGGSKRKYVPR